MCGCFFPALVLWAREPGVGLKPHASQGERSVGEIPLDSQLHLWEQGQPFLHVHMCTGLSAASSVSPWLVRLQLVCSRLFTLVASYFSCNSSLVLGGGE